MCLLVIIAVVAVSVSYVLQVAHLFVRIIQLVIPVQLLLVPFWPYKYILKSVVTFKI